jgi:hypothetical protein
MACCQLPIVKYEIPNQYFPKLKSIFRIMDKSPVFVLLT